MSTKVQRNRLTIGAIALVVVVGVVLILMNRSTPGPSLAADTTKGSGTSTDAEGAISSIGVSVSISDQSAGSSVAVRSVTCDAPCWVAVRDSNNWILGAAWLSKGTHADVAVPLLRSTEAGGKYSVVLYTDDGDKVFDHKKDAIVTGGVGSRFSAQ